ncbi:antitoxin VapB family protein [Pseudoteredinibacter isoporae]|uniref:Uncharacterized protein n=1 Tax=Pseudoteredinibacter isoporae TaxID=570281 RepID=A0A7X0MY54_9GAMM|nr:antitoxin VapB family protein [Pseudoteredinibacter isoporae]MBB6523905.1 hypothetical protein [Pseudoteredinibacter isoporae]NHO89404.1 hypothetical protein [Pseudoteredinibacter isoporae]NIB22794.1 hypothetical protein [Pseudoteredinibacter isoporae]
MAGRKPWKLEELDKEYACRWILKKFGEDERRACIEELNNIIDSWPPYEKEALKNAIRQDRRRRRMSEDMFTKPVTIEVQSHVYNKLKAIKKDGESFSKVIERIAENVTQ